MRLFKDYSCRKHYKLTPRLQRYDQLFQTTAGNQRV